jgi:hypothetical protein
MVTVTVCQRSADEEHWPSRSQTPPTPPVQAGPSQSSPPSPRPMRQRAMAQLLPVSIPEIVQLPADRSDFDVHRALLDDKVQNKCHTLRFAMYCPLLCLNNLLYAL